MLNEIMLSVMAPCSNILLNVLTEKSALRSADQSFSNVHYLKKTFLLEICQSCECCCLLGVNKNSGQWPIKKRKGNLFIVAIECCLNLQFLFSVDKFEICFMILKNTFDLLNCSFKKTSVSFSCHNVCAHLKLEPFSSEIKSFFTNFQRQN